MPNNESKSALTFIQALAPVPMKISSGLAGYPSLSEIYSATCLLTVDIPGDSVYAPECDTSWMTEKFRILLTVFSSNSVSNGYKLSQHLE